ncbi:MAG: hypothetical protein L6Q54_09475, partial [Leptospiraceae bacterium]|nr:hypothetical protein [Leptospiraceae bacterium]
RNFKNSTKAQNLILKDKPICKDSTSTISDLRLQASVLRSGVPTFLHKKPSIIIKRVILLKNERKAHPIELFFYLTT